jgi:hypothetical protein
MEAQYTVLSVAMITAIPIMMEACRYVIQGVLVEQENIQLHSKLQLYTNKITKVVCGLQRGRWRNQTLVRFTLRPKEWSCAIIKPTLVV